MRAPAWLIAALLLVPALGAAQQRYSATRLSEVSLTLQRLCEVQAVSGHENLLSRRIASLLPPGVKGSLDARGNLIVELGEGPPVMTFIAHQDEIGYEVKGVEADGRLTLTRRGGFYDLLLEGHPVVIETSGGPVSGVVTPRPGYLDARTEHEGVTTEDLRVDAGTDSWAATGALGIKAGDPVAVPKNFARLGATEVSARSLDDRAGCAALLLSIPDLVGRPLRHKVRFVFSSREELGLLGAEFAAHQEPGSMCFAVDMFPSSDSPLENGRVGGVLLGQGCAVRAIDASWVARRPLVERVLRLSREAHIPIQAGVTGGGNDGFRYVVEGANMVPLSWPLRSTHSAAETSDLRDIAALADLVKLLVEKW